MQKINSLLKKSIVYRDLNNNNSIDYRKRLTTKLAESIIRQASDLISNEDFKPYFFNTLYMIGPENFYEAMDYAKKQDVRCQPCIFVKRLKEYRNAVENKNSKKRLP